MKLATLPLVALAACASAAQADYDKRMSCAATLEVMGNIMRAAGQLTPVYQRSETEMKGVIAGGLLATGKTIGKTTGQIDAEFKTATADKAESLRGKDEPGSRKAIAQLGEEAIACVKTYQRKKS